MDGKDLVADIEGLTLAPDGKDGGYLIASVQGNSSYALFSLPDTNLVARFRIVANADKSIDEVTGTDGIALTVGNFGDQYPSVYWWCRMMKILEQRRTSNTSLGATS